MNFWELVLSDELENNERAIGLISAFDDLEIQRIIDIINSYIEKKQELTKPFIDRVPEQVASDYRLHVSAEMYLSLIMERLINRYYRT